MKCRAPHCVYDVDDTWAVCDTCWLWRVDMLRELPWLWLRVEKALVPSGSAALRERVSTNAPGSSIPLRTGPLYALDYAMEMLGVWVDTLQRLGCRFEGPPADVRNSYVFAQRVQFIKMSDSRFAGSPLAGDYYLDIYKAYWTLARVDNSRADAVRVPEPCPACGRRTLIERHAGEYVQCLTCARTWSQAALAKETR